jgi:hypothetical protein
MGCNMLYMKSRKSFKVKLEFDRHLFKFDFFQKIASNAIS